jgi:hypothetical protein
MLHSDLSVMGLVFIAADTVRLAEASSRSWQHRLAAILPDPLGSVTFGLPESCVIDYGSGYFLFFKMLCYQIDNSMSFVVDFLP